MPAVLAFPYACICAILIYKLADKQLSLYRRFGKHPEVCGPFLFSLTVLPLLYFSWIAALGCALGEWRGILLGLAGAAASVGAEHGIVWWKTRPRNKGHRVNGSGQALGSDRFGDRDLLPLATYALEIAMLIYASFLLLRYLYGYWDGTNIGAAELAASMLMVIPALGWFSVFLATLLNPDGKDQQKALFWARVLVAVMVLAGFVGYVVYREFRDIYGRQGFLGILCYSVSSWVAATALLRIFIDWKPGRRCEALRRHVPPFTYAVLWILAETNIVHSYPNEKWVHAPEFILFVVAMVLECRISTKALFERVRENQNPVWEKALGAYRVIGIAVSCLSLVCGDSHSSLVGVGQCLASLDSFVLTAHRVMAHAAQCLASAGDVGAGYSTILANGAIQTLVGVVTVEYYIAFRAALKEQNKERMVKPRRRKRLQPRSRLSSFRRKQG